MADDGNWAGRGFSRPGPVTEQATDCRHYARPEPVSSQRSGDCPLHMWGGAGHSAPFRGCEGEPEREAGG
jgi:hypothetical protein